MEKKRFRLIFIFLLIFSSGFLVFDFIGIFNTLNTESGNEFPDTSLELEISAWGWDTVEVISTESTESSLLEGPQIVADGQGNLHVVWMDETDIFDSGTDWDVFYKCWNASTGIWSGHVNATDVVSTESTGSSRAPAIAIDDFDNVHIAWWDPTNITGSGTDNDILYKSWNASTGAWNPIEVVSTESTDNCYNPTIAVDGAENIHIAWPDNTDYGADGADRDIVYKFWNVSSKIWNGYINSTDVVSTESTLSSSNPRLVVDDSKNVYIVWHDISDYAGAGPDRDIFYKFWNATASTWSGNVNETDVVSIGSTDDSFDPKIAIDGSKNTHIVWEDITDDYGGSGADRDIFYKFWNASSGTWNMTDLVSIVSTDNSFDPSVEVDGAGNIHVVWEDTTDYIGAGSDYDIFYQNRNLSSGAWSVTEVISTDIYAISANPSITIDIKGYPHVAWADRANYNGSGIDYDIFYNTIIEVPGAPILEPIVPNVDPDGIIELNWSGSAGATNYYVYCDTSFITHVIGKVSIDNTTDTNYTHTITADYTYYYVIVAGNSTGNSSISNCENVTVQTHPANVPKWDLTWGGSGYEEGYSVAVDAYNNTYLAGSTSSFGGVPRDAFLVKFDSNGNEIWNKTWDGGASDKALSVTVDDYNNSYIAGYKIVGITEEAILVKFDKDGSEIWNRTWTLALGDCLGYDVGVDSQNNTYIAGYVQTSVNANDAFLVKYDSNGTYIWNQTWGGSSDDYCYGLVVDGDDNITITGIDGSFNSLSDDVVLIKYDSDGNKLWNMSWSSSPSTPECGSGVTVDDYNNIYLTGYYNTGKDMLVMKYDPEGNKLWHQFWGESPVFDYGNDIAVDKYNNSYIAGATASIGIGSFDAFLVMYDDGGNEFWSRTYGTPEWDGGNGVAVDAYNNTYLAGVLDLLGPDPEAFLVKYTPPIMPNTPVLDPITPNPSFDGIINLNWSDINEADYYRVYRELSAFNSFDGLTPLASVTDGNWSDYIIINDTFYYAISAVNRNGTSDITNCESVYVNITEKWLSPEIVSTETPPENWSRYSSVGIDGMNNVHVIWEEWTEYGGSGTDWDVFYKFKNATTETWSTTEVVSTESSEHSMQSALAVDQLGNVHVVWEELLGAEFDINYKRRNVTTGSWSPVEIVSVVGNDWSRWSALAVDASGNLHLAYYDPTDYNGSQTDGDIFYRCWNFTTANWTTTEVVSTESTGGSVSATIAIDIFDNIHIAWRDSMNYDGSGTDNDIFYKYKNATTKSWSTMEVVSTESTVSSMDPTIAVDISGNVHVAWQRWISPIGSIQYKYKNATNGTWTTVEEVSMECTEDSDVPSIIADNFGGIHLVWEDGTDYGGSGIDNDIMYKYKNMSSQVWSKLEIATSEQTRYSNSPWIDADDSGNIHLTWHDGNDIIYKYRFGEYDFPPQINLLSPMNGSTIKSGEIIQFSILDSDLDMAWYSLDGGQNLTLNSPYSINTSIWSEGLRSLAVYANDSQQSLSFKNYTFLVDNALPTVAITSPANGSILITTVISVNGSCNSTGSNVVSISINDTRFQIDTDPTGLPEGSFSFINSSTLSGRFGVKIDVFDGAGNKGEETLWFYVDYSIPDASITSPANDGGLISSINVTINGTANGTGSLIKSIELNTSEFTLDISPVGNPSGAFSFINSTDILEGIYALSINVTDEANKSVIITRWFYVDRTPPLIQLEKPGYDNDGIGGSILTLNGSTNGTGIMIDHIWTNNSASWSISIDPAGTLGGSFSFTNITVIADGLYTLNITVNTSSGLSASVVRSFWVDNEQPPTPAGLNRSVSGNSVLLMWLPVADLTNVSYMVYRNGVNIKNTTWCNFTDANLPPGTYTYQIYAIDNAGNICSTAATITAVIGGAPPPFWIIIIIILIIGISSAAGIGTVVIFKKRSGAAAKSKKKQVYMPKLKTVKGPTLESMVLKEEGPRIEPQVQIPGKEMIAPEAVEPEPGAVFPEFQYICRKCNVFYRVEKEGEYRCNNCDEPLELYKP